MGALRFMLVATPALFLPRPHIPLGWLLAYGLSISVAQFAFLFSAIALGMPAGLASTVLQSQIFFTLLFSALFLAESWRAEQLLGLCLSLGGLAFIGMSHGLSMPLAGFLLTLAAGASWALGNVVNRHIAKRYTIEPFSFVCWAGLVPPIPFLLLSYYVEGPEAIKQGLLHFNASSAFALVYLAFAATLIGYGLWSRLLSRYAANVVAPFSLLLPLIGLITAAVAYQEQLSMLQGIGITLLLLGLMVNILGSKLRMQQVLPTTR